MTSQNQLDVICMEPCRCGSLQRKQIGGRLEDMRTFAGSIRRVSTNAIGGARLGLRAGLISRVGDEHNGRFIRETLLAEGVGVKSLRTDPTRLTALVFLGIRDATHVSRWFSIGSAARTWVWCLMTWTLTTSPAPRLLSSAAHTCRIRTRARPV